MAGCPLGAAPLAGEGGAEPLRRAQDATKEGNASQVTASAAARWAEVNIVEMMGCSGGGSPASRGTLGGAPSRRAEWLGEFPRRHRQLRRDGDSKAAVVVV